jgi:hypothetical protein
MRRSIEFLLGLLDREECPCVSAEDFDGEHGPMLRSAQQMGLIEQEPGMNPIASCPHCEDGVPYRLGERLLCNGCHSTVDPRSLLLWRVDRMAFLAWVGARWELRGGVQRLDATLWQLGTLESKEGIYECFYRRSGEVSQAAKARLSAYRQVIVLYGVTPPDPGHIGNRTHLSLLELLREGPSLALAKPLSLSRPGGTIRFLAESGALWAGATFLGEVRVGTKEYFFLDCLARHLDTFVPYADLKQDILRRSGSKDSRDEATFCHRLKSAIKKKCIPEIDRLVVTTNKSDGYRLRGCGER